MPAPKQFLLAEYIRLLQRIANDTSDNFHCRAETVCLINQILTIEYPYQEDDLEYLLDMTNYHMRELNYQGQKSRFPISKYLDLICRDEFYITSWLQSEDERDSFIKTMDPIPIII